MAANKNVHEVLKLSNATSRTTRSVSRLNAVRMVEDNSKMIVDDAEQTAEREKSARQSEQREVKTKGAKRPKNGRKKAAEKENVGKSSRQVKFEVCKFYLQSSTCPIGDKCQYKHADFPCKYYHSGIECPQKLQCKFAHGGPLSDVALQALKQHVSVDSMEMGSDNFMVLTRKQNAASRMLCMIDVTQASMKKSAAAEKESGRPQQATELREKLGFMTEQQLQSLEQLLKVPEAQALRKLTFEQLNSIGILGTPQFDELCNEVFASKFVPRSDNINRSMGKEVVNIANLPLLSTLFDVMFRSNVASDCMDVARFTYYASILKSQICYVSESGALEVLHEKALDYIIDQLSVLKYKVLKDTESKTAKIIAAVSDSIKSLTQPPMGSEQS